MALDRKNISFMGVNTLYEFSSWSKLENASVLANSATIGPNGLVGTSLDPEYNDALSSANYRQFTLVLTFEPNEELNYTNDVLEIRIIELYGANSNSNVYKNDRVIAFTQDDLIKNSDDTYTLRRIYPTENRAMQSCEVYIINRTLNPIEVRDADLQRSADISTGQLGTLINSMNDAATPTSFKIYTDESGGYINGLGVIIASGLELKYKPTFEGDLLNAIETNFSDPIPIVYVADMIDLTTNGSETEGS